MKNIRKYVKLARKSSEWHLMSRTIREERNIEETPEDTYKEQNNKNNDEEVGACQKDLK